MATEPPTTTAAEPLELPPLTYKTHVLKVSIHCEGCKRKVKKVLHSIEGVYKADIDTKLQKVTVTGNVEAQTLLKKLIKSNKHAELWPEPPEQKDKKSKKSKKKDKQCDPDSSNDEDAPEAEKPPVKVEVVQEPARISDGGSNTAKITGGGGAPVKTSGGAVRFVEVGAKTGGGPVVGGGGVAKTGGGTVLETKVEGKKPETGSAANQSPAVEKIAGGGGESDDCIEKSGGGGGGNGSGGKKKKKKGHKVGFEGEPSSGGAASNTMQANHYAGPPQVILSPPSHQGHQFPPPNYYAPPQQPVYVMSYNTAHPTSSHTTSYYSSPRPHSYAYAYSGPETEPQPSDFESYPRQPLDSFEMFSDENPNGCSVM